MTIDDRIKTIEQRLNTGYDLIDKRKAAGLDVTKLEDFWIQLLREYESAVDESMGRTQKGVAA
jgi:hypothetical protein